METLQTELSARAADGHKPATIETIGATLRAIGYRLGITGTHGNIGTRGNSEKMPEPVGISESVRAPEHYQYLPAWAKIAIERLDADSDLRNGPMLDQLLDAYAKSNGQACDQHTRASSHHICGRRFWNFAPLPADPAPNPEPAEPVGIQAEPMEISAPLVDDTEPAGIPRNRDTDYYEWLIGSVSQFACARRITYREAAAIADPCRARMRSEYLAGASVHDMCRILGEINPEPVDPEPVAIADGGPVVFNADRREWVHAGTIEPEPVENEPDHRLPNGDPCDSKGIPLKLTIAPRGHSWHGQVLRPDLDGLPVRPALEPEPHPVGIRHGQDPGPVHPGGLTAAQSLAFFRRHGIPGKLVRRIGARELREYRHMVRFITGDVGPVETRILAGPGEHVIAG